MIVDKDKERRSAHANPRVDINFADRAGQKKKKDAKLEAIIRELESRFKDDKRDIVLGKF